MSKLPNNVALLKLPSERPVRFGQRTVPSFYTGFKSALEAEQMSFAEVDYRRPDFWIHIQQFTCLVMRPKGNDIDLSIAAPIIFEAERRGIACYPSFSQLFYCGDKHRVAEFFRANELNAPNTISLRSQADLTFHKDNLTGRKIVVKTIRGASSRNVTIVNGYDELAGVAKRFFAGKLVDGELGARHDPFVQRLKKRLSAKLHRRNDIEGSVLIAQEFIPDCEGDIRITTIGKRAFIFERKNRPNDFRASGSGKIDYEVKPYHAALATKLLAVSDKHGFSSMAYDILRNAVGQHYLIEMNYTFTPQAVQACKFYYLADGELYENDTELSVERMILREVLNAAKQPNNMKDTK